MIDSYWRISAPSLGRERIWCSNCKEYTIRKYGVCVRRDCSMAALAAAFYRKPPPMRRRKTKGPVRLCDPVTGLERKG